jgi:2-C-methyl-D-erythritol 4-phosphate cytidylyltransferase
LLKLGHPQKRVPFYNHYCEVKPLITTKSCLQYTTVKEKEIQKVSAIIVCGGSSSRMNGVDKVFETIGNMPVAARSINAFEQNDKISNIVVVVKQESVLKMQQLCEQYAFKKVTDIVEGGNCRQQSVANGFKALDDNTDFVLIHDGARPFVSRDCVNRVLDAAKMYSAVTCAVKCKDTIKVIRADGLVTNTPDRSTLVSVQTPQGFAVDVYKKALKQFNDRLEQFTDDCSLVEAIGFPVYVVDGEYTNIKITTPDDLEYAKILIERGELH